MNRSIFIAAALCGGFVLPVQVAINTLLKKHIGQPMQVTFVSYVAGALGALLVCVIARYPLPTAVAISGTSWWMWFAGCLGTFYVWSTIFAAPQIGAALTLALTVAGQMIAAILLDHYGVFGLQRYPVSTTRLVGIILVIAGVSLVSFSKK
jgi:transporter family-2 protein